MLAITASLPFNTLFSPVIIKDVLIDNERNEEHTEMVRFGLSRCQMSSYQQP